jgi:hypothetical protein
MLVENTGASGTEYPLVPECTISIWMAKLRQAGQKFSPVIRLVIINYFCTAIV